ncbi:MAG: DUF58 domain-containing protein [Desulfuromonadales bacterium]|nr:DUF58 domain-containing protein [Desulfuromonadales bacterium]
MALKTIIESTATGAESPSTVRLDMDELIALRRLVGAFSLNPRQIRSGQGGCYQSRIRGRGMEFAEVRAYLPGDDVRNIDWRVTARRGKPHTKLFQEERERPVLLALDYRRPMFFATRGCFKAVQASKLAALLAWRALAQGDRIGAFLFSEERHCELRPQLGKAGVLSLLRQMVADPAWQRPLHHPFEPQQRLAQTLMRLRRVAKPGSLVLILSDFAQWDEMVSKQLSLLSRSNDVGLVFCYDPLEAELPPAGSYRVSDGASDLTLSTLDRAGRADYQQRFLQHRQQIEQFCAQHKSLFLSCATNDDPLDCLTGLFRRGRS